MKYLNLLVTLTILSTATAHAGKSEIISAFSTAKKVVADTAVDVTKATTVGQKFVVTNSNKILLMAEAEGEKIVALKFRAEKPSRQIDDMINSAIQDASDNFIRGTKVYSEVADDGARIYIIQYNHTQAHATQTADMIISGIKRLLNDPDNMIRGASGL